MRVRFAGWVVALLAAAAVAGGCADDKTAEVTGTISVDGNPAEKGSISFVPADGKSPTAGSEIKNGKYAAKVPLGTAKVQVRVPKVVGKKKLYNTPDSPVQDILEEALPGRYNDKTELQYEVKPGKNEKDWDLKSK